MALVCELVPCRTDNYGVLVHDPASGETAAIDAPEAAPLLAALEARSWRLTSILVTHRHADHVEGIDALKRRFGARVVGPAAEAGGIPGLDATVAEGDTVRIGEVEGRVIATPGHTREHVAYVFEAERLAFVGDTLFAIGCGRVFEGTMEEMWASLMKLAALPDDTKVYCGHEYTLSNARFALSIDGQNAALAARAAAVDLARREGRPTIPTSIAEEKATNPFLRADDPAIRASLGMGNAPAQEVFAELRRRKDAF